MAGLNINDVIEITYQGTILGQRVLNVLHYFVDAPSTDPSYLSALSHLLGNFKAGAVSPTIAFLNAVAQNYNLDTLKGQVVYPTRKAYVLNNVDLPGLIGSNCTAQNLSGVITKRTSVGTRKGVGALHMPALPPTGYADGLITNAQRTLYGAVQACLLNPFTDSLETTRIEPCLWSRSSPGTVLGLTATQLQPEVRTMRRRTIGRGI